MLKRPPEMIVCDRARKDEIQWAFHTFPSSVVERMRSKDEQLVNPGIEVVRNRLLSDGHDIAGVGFAVGYDSPSQFSREYSRQFGQPPGRDLERLRAEPLGAAVL